jgi:hypothetical protein
MVDLQALYLMMYEYGTHSHVSGTSNLDVKNATPYHTDLAMQLVHLTISSLHSEALAKNKKQPEFANLSTMLLFLIQKTVEITSNLKEILLLLKVRCKMQAKIHMSQYKKN